MSAVTFDVWHTLVYLSPEDEEAYYRAQVATALEALRRGSPAGPFAPERTDDELSRGFERVLEEAVQAAERGVTVTPLEQIRRVGEATGRQPDGAQYLASLDRLVERTPFRAAPGAADLLGRLHDDGYRVATVGNTVGEAGASLRKVLSAAGLGRYIETFVFSDEHPWAKPSPELFHEALRRLGETPERSAHVGDAWFDIEGARRARFLGAILFTGLNEYGPHYRRFHARPSEGGPPRPDRVIRELSEVEPIVREMLPRPSKSPRAPLEG